MLRTLGNGHTAGPPPFPSVCFLSLKLEDNPTENKSLPSVPRLRSKRRRRDTSKQCNGCRKLGNDARETARARHKQIVANSSPT
ncbi:hypothetical protein CH063_07852 [Colletotrichum higginsianum]|uniref:Uncharacterized protein n=1 Tax=Colletotrichum higginsianum (strain IMI 349063) TaxID=759273 RepID=H1V7N6_COLHI|nr:hypothetical protein CH63R_02584 [Colletotrichum higginsianum IMI 349063]OBR13858.1 hypothetical protein CH63R_02584 [Colletotrichum higginsianum IMI 349063]CCF36238.1 hypothetical protein CH063_07852 [Colletotrichum higginsianum]